MGSGRGGAGSGGEGRGPGQGGGATPRPGAPLWAARPVLETGWAGRTSPLPPLGVPAAPWSIAFPLPALCFLSSSRGSSRPGLAPGAETPISGVFQAARLGGGMVSLSGWPRCLEAFT